MQQDIPELAEQLRSLFDGNDLKGLAPLLGDDVRWGGDEDTDDTCHNRADVLAWYGKLQSAGVDATVHEVMVEGDSIVVALTMTWPAAFMAEHHRPPVVYQVFRVDGGKIADIRGYPERDEALAEARRRHE